MKKILAILYFITLFSVLAFGQDKTGSVDIDSASTITAAFGVPDGHDLSGISLPNMRTGTTTLYVLTTIDGTTYDTLYYGGSRYEETVVATGCNLTLKIPVVYNWSKFKLAFNIAQIADITIKTNFTRKIN